MDNLVDYTTFYYAGMILTLLYALHPPIVLIKNNHKYKKGQKVHPPIQGISSYPGIDWGYAFELMFKRLVISSLFMILYFLNSIYLAMHAV